MYACTIVSIVYKPLGKTIHQSIFYHDYEGAMAVALRWQYACRGLDLEIYIKKRETSPNFLIKLPYRDEHLLTEICVNSLEHSLKKITGSRPDLLKTVYNPKIGSALILPPIIYCTEGDPKVPNSKGKKRSILKF